MPSAVLTAAMLAAGCGSGVVLSFATDGTQPIGSYCIGIGSRVGADVGTRKFGQRYVLTDFPLPQTLGLNGDGALPVTVRLIGQGTRGPSAGFPVTSSSLTAPLSAHAAPLTLSACKPQQSMRALSRRDSFATTATQAAIMRTGSEGDGASLVLLGEGGGLRHVVSLSTTAVDENLPVAGAGLAPLIALDANGDCGDDLIVASSDGTSVWTSDATGQLTDGADPLASARTGRTVVAGDLDEDGWLDLVTAGEDGAQVLLADRAGGFAPLAAAIDKQPTGAKAMALGDLDGDGHLDAMVGATGAPLRWLQGDGNGHLTLVAGSFTMPFAVTAIVLRDLDDDGDLDALVATTDGAPGLRLFVNDGQGRFTDGSVVGVPASIGANLIGLVSGDLDGDCIDELVVLRATMPPLLVGVTELGQFQVVGPIGTAIALSATIGDLDGDGANEVVLVSDRQVSIWSRVAGAL